MLHNNRHGDGKDLCVVNQISGGPLQTPRIVSSQRIICSVDRVCELNISEFCKRSYIIKIVPLREELTKSVGRTYILRQIFIVFYLTFFFSFFLFVFPH